MKQQEKIFYLNYTKKTKKNPVISKVKKLCTCCNISPFLYTQISLNAGFWGACVYTGCKGTVKKN